MTKMLQMLVCVILMAGLATGCGQSAVTADDRAASGVEAQGSQENIAAPDGTGAAQDDATVSVDIAPGSAAPTAPARADVAAATVPSLPLKRGFYVASGTPCGNASNATLMLITREGINWSRDVCTFNRIEKIDATSYRVAARCSGEESSITFEIPRDTSFTAKYQVGGESSARYCEQSHLPDPWRDNDISDLIG